MESMIDSYILMSYSIDGLVFLHVFTGASLIVAYGAVKKGAAQEGMSLREYLWRGHDPTSVAVLMEVLR